MKKTTLGMITILVLVSTACGSRSLRTVSTVEPVTDSAGMTTNYQNAVPIETQLLVGTFKLEGTDQAVDAKQAPDLAAYWQVLKELTTSGSAAQEEIDATVEAIESAMMPAQIKAITAMKISRQDMFTTLREQGGGFATGTQSNRTQGTGNQTQGTGNQRNFGPPGGFDGGGGFPPGAGFGPQQTNTNRSSNSQSTNGNSFTSTRVPSALLDAVIKLLQEKAQP